MLYRLSWLSNSKSKDFQALKQDIVHFHNIDIVNFNIAILDIDIVNLDIAILDIVNSDIVN